MPTNTYLISVRPVWASAFFLSHNAKSIELRKGNFGTSLKPGDVIAIYATLPVGKLIGRVRVIKHESLTIDRLWQESQQGRLAKVSHAQFDAYYASQVFGVGVWVSAAELLPSPIARGPTSPELGPSLAATAADSTINRRSDRDGTLTSVAEHRQHKRALRC